MERFKKFFATMFSEWGSGLSGPASVPLAVLALFASGAVLKAVYGSFAVILGFVSAFRIWAKEHDRAEAANGEIARLKKNYFDERPRVTFALRGPKTLQEWRSLESVHPPPIFRLEHSGGRVARFVRIDPVVSSLGLFRMEFDEAPTLNSGHRQVHQLVFTIYQNGADDLSYDPRILEIQQGVNMLSNFFCDHPREEKEGTHEVTVRYRDQDGATEYRESFILTCQYPRMLLPVDPKSQQ